MRALLGVSDRSGIVDFARGLRDFGIELIATDGTRAALAEAGIQARSVAEVTGLPEMLDGRVKTLQAPIFAGILARRDREEHMAQLAEHGFGPIDIVAVNLYPFAATVASGSPYESIIEKIDIGGPSLIRAAAKNADCVTVVVAPARYPSVLDELQTGGSVSAGLRHRLAAEAFAHVAAYDTDIAAYLRSQHGGNELPEHFTIGGERLHPLRYGENPHQQGALYAIPGKPGGVARARVLQGPGLSFTNWLDADAAHRLVHDFEQPAACVIKHTNPCGFAVAIEGATAYRRAYECDPRAAFGGVVGLNRPIDAAMVEALGKTFLEAVVAPSITEEAVQLLAARERLRVLIVDKLSHSDQVDVRSIDGGLLVQTLDRIGLGRQSMTSPTSRQPSGSEWGDMEVAWRVCRHVKSNAIVIVKDGMAVGVGAGQMSRVEAAQLAIQRAGESAQGAVAASDAFFPMPDGLEVLGRAGISAVIQPGGSKKDAEVTAAADALGMAMVHAGERHFRH